MTTLTFFSEVDCEVLQTDYQVDGRTGMGIGKRASDSEKGAQYGKG